MAKLARLLTNDHPLFVHNVVQLERATGGAGIDMRLVVDITEKAHRVMRQLRLDPADTSARELYHALDAAATKELLEDTQYVLAEVKGEVVSLCMLDVDENRQQRIAFERRNIGHAQRHLRREIIRRYAEHDRTDNLIVHKLAEDIGLAGEGLMSEIKHSKHDRGGEMSEDRNNIPYILCIGDINTNAFIKMNEKHGEITTDENGYTRLSIEMGGKIPYDDVEEFRAGECSPNAAVSMTRLGLDVDLMTWIGDDEAGKRMVEYLKEQGVGTDYIVAEQGLKSNYHYVLRFGADRTKLQKFEDYSYQWRDPSRVPDWIYLGVLGENTWPLHEALLGYLNRNPSVKLIFQPGMFHLMWGAEKLAEFYKKAEVVIMNREEAAQVTGRERSSVSGLIQGLHDLGVSIAVVTDGPEGAYASDGTRILQMPNYPDPAPPFERTGAGDAFASTLSAALALGEPLETALRWAPINSAYVVQQMGAQRGLLPRDELLKHLAEASEDYRPAEFSDS